ncbi:MAG TPA: Rrf2 family transcriptional regulator, partial [Kineosporiaceae bacterium]
MHVSAKTDYGLRALRVLAQRRPDLVTVETLSTAEGLPRKFVELILSDLRRAGLVFSRRGILGGYGLAVPPERITVGAVIRILDGPLDQHERRSGASTAGAATLAKVWTAATASLANVLDRTTLAHL